MKKLVIIALLTGLLTVSALAVVPNEMEHEERDGYRFIIKTFELAPNADARQLEEKPFELMGYKYVLFSMTKDEKAFDDSREHTETVTVETKSKDTQAVLDALLPTIEYDQDGYTGTLTLDHTSIKTEASGYGTQSYGLTDTKTLTDLDRNDSSYIPKTTVKSGVTLSLSNIEWSVQAVDEDMEPVSYSAVAYYSGSYSASVAKGYVTTATYKGEVESSGISSVIYTVTYIGEEISPEPTPTPTPTPTPEPMPEPVPEPETSQYFVPEVYIFYAFVALLILAAMCKAALANRRKVYEIRNEETGRYITPSGECRELSEIRAGFTPALPLIPSELLLQIITFFRSVMTGGRNYEAIANIYWDREREEYHIAIPKQHVSSVRAESDLSGEYEPERFLHYMDVHSHNVMPARFSAQDDSDEKSTRLYAVIGKLNDFIPELSVRISNGGKYLLIDPSTVFESFGDYYPVEWNDQITFDARDYELPENNDGKMFQCLLRSFGWKGRLCA